MSQDTRPHEGYERSDVSIRAVVVFILSLTVATAGILVLMSWLFTRYELRELRDDLAQVPATRLTDELPPGPAGPILQGAPGSKFELQDPVREMQAHRRYEDELLGSYGWVDRNAGVVRIPIDEAKRLLLARGLPVRAGVEKDVP